ncbi:MAG: sigma-70 family RNA polymerase sigma factor, partial [Planctomycetota bacterium]|nr:sigma-70 family RNA polymerase sigma factor [Planctomycetota bacterium]
FRANRSARRRARHEERAFPPRAGAAPAERLALEEAKASVLAAVASLPSHYRAVVQLRFFDNLASSEIADRLSIAPSTVRTRLQRALALMRMQLESTWNGDARALYTGLLCFAAGRTTEAASWTAKLGAAAALLIAGAAWLAALSQPDAAREPTPVVAAAVAPAASPEAETTTSLARTPARVPAAPARRLIAGVTVTGPASLGDSVDIEITVEPGGATMRRTIPLRRRERIDLAEVVATGWPNAVWVHARHAEGAAAAAVRVAVPASSDDATVYLPVTVTVHAFEEAARESPRGTPTTPLPERVAPALRAPALASRRARRARTVRSRRGGAAPTAAAPAASPAAFPILQRATVRSSTGQAESAPRTVVSAPPPRPAAAPADARGDPDAHRRPERIGGFDVVALAQAMAPGGTVVIRVEGERDGEREPHRLWLGDAAGPWFVLPDGWRETGEIRFAGLVPGEYRLFGIDDRGEIRPHERFVVRPAETVEVRWDARRSVTRTVARPHVPELHRLWTDLVALAQRHPRRP